MNFGEAKELFRVAVTTLDVDEHNETRLAWEERSRQLNELCPYRRSAQIRVLLCCILLARSVDENEDIRRINLPTEGSRAPTSGRSYTARTVADYLVAPLAAQYKVDIGSKSPNPLNSNAFVNSSVRRLEHVQNMRNKEGWQYFLGLVDEIEKLGREDAFQAFKGYISANISKGKDLSIEIPAGIKIFELTQRIGSFIEKNSKYGASAQALVATCADFVNDTGNVIARKLNDPDRHYPCDVSVEDENGGILVAYEVKDKPITFLDILTATKKMEEEDNIPGKLVVCAFRGIKTDDGANSSLLKETTVPIVFFTRIHDFISHAFLSSNMEEKEFIDAFATIFVQKLDEIDIVTEKEREILSDLFRER